MTDDFVPADVARDRMQHLVGAVERHALAKYQERVGRVEEVLVEGPSKTDASITSGRTRQNKLVHFAGDAETGSYVDVRITGAAAHWLHGEHVGLVRAPRRGRTRIPVAAEA